MKKSRSAQAGPPAEDTDEASPGGGAVSTGAACAAAPEPEDDEEAKGVRRAARAAPAPEGAHSECRADGGRGSERGGLFPNDDAAVDSEKPDEKWLEDDEDAPIAGLPGVQVQIRAADDGINFEVREAALVVSGTTDATMI